MSQDILGPMNIKIIIEPWLSGLFGLSAPVWALSGRCLGAVWLDT